MRILTPVMAEPALSADSFTREDVTFPGKGLALSAWLFLPKDASAADELPAIVMGPHFSAVKEMGFSEIAAHFAGEGFAVLVFDYRTFGGSEGEPRCQLIWYEQIEDYFAQTLLVRVRRSKSLFSDWRINQHPPLAVESQRLKLAKNSKVLRTSRDTHSGQHHRYAHSLEICRLPHYVGASQIVAAASENFDQQFGCDICEHIVGIKCVTTRVVMLHESEIALRVRV